MTGRVCPGQATLLSTYTPGLNHFNKKWFSLSILSPGTLRQHNREYISILRNSTQNHSTKRLVGIDLFFSFFLSSQVLMLNTSLGWSPNVLLSVSSFGRCEEGDGGPSLVSPRSKILVLPPATFFLGAGSGGVIDCGRLHPPE